MSTETDYKRAYERQKSAREKAESLLEVRSRELYDLNENLKSAYEELKEQKNHLVQQEKLASIGLLAAGVAHEINNPVGFVKSNLQTLEHYTESYTAVLNAYRALTLAIKENKPDDQVATHLNKLDELIQSTDLDHIAQDGVDCIQESLSGVERIEEIIVNLSDFARAEGDDRVQCDINELLENTLKLVWNEIKYKCEIEKDFGELPKLWGRTGQLRQVFVNIVVNAAQAIEGEGLLKICTRADDENVSVDIIDNGPGMNAETLNKLFDPFYTTKEVGSGTGLGLYVSHGIVANHLGTLTAKNNSEGGACFTVTLPIEVRRKR